jgi:hypothetical protein
MPSPSEHARLSASGSKRWMGCPGSLQYEEQFPESTSAYAEEGRRAHAYAERILLEGLELPDDPEYDVASYVEYVRARQTETGGDLHIETRLDLSAYVPDGFGTGDAVIFHNGELEIIDLKYGKGVRVDPDHNTQLMLYGLGAYWTYEPVYAVAKVKTTIVQPRINALGSAEYTTEELLKWAEEVVAPAAVEALTGSSRFNPGEHCQFCRAKGVCKARAQAMMVAVVDTVPIPKPDPRSLTPDAIAKVLQQADDVLKWIKDVQDYALEAAESGAKFPGYKLVEGRSNRKVSDEEALVKAAKKAGIEEPLLYTRKMLGITDLERLFGKKNFVALPEGIITKAPGKPVLVEANDKRPELSSAGSDFAHIEEV